MDRTQELQDNFLKCLNELFHEDGQFVGYLSSVASATKMANQCINEGHAVVEENRVVASEYYCLASLVCLEYLIEKGMAESLLEKGCKSAEMAAGIIPDDYEYQLFKLYFRIISLNPAEAGYEKAFSFLQQIHRECPPFHIITNSILSVEYLESLYNLLFENKLQEVVIQLDDSNSNQCEEAALLLKTFPSNKSKLLAFNVLARFYGFMGNLDEALRNAKLGVELLGSNVEYDYRNYEHFLWGGCWTLVGVISREKKDYDFAASVLEKGANLGIVPCMTNLAEMYEKGEGDDPEPEEAERYRDLAKTTQEARDKEKAEEEERIRKEEEARLAEIRRQEEEQRLAEELEARKKEIRIRKILLWGGIAICAIGIIIGIIYLCRETIEDRVYKYENAGLAILHVDKSDDGPYVIIMSNETIYYDNMKSVSEIVPVGISMNAREIRLAYDSYGVTAVSGWAEQPLAITSSRYVNCIRISEGAFLLLKENLSNNPMVTPGLPIDSGYLVIREDSQKTTVIRFPKSKTDGKGNLYWELSGDIMDRYDSHFKSTFQETEYKKIIERKFGLFYATIQLSLTRGNASIINTIRFDRLHMICSPEDVGTNTHRESMKAAIRQVFRDELIESFIVNASRVTGISDRSKMHISPDDRYTFVVDPNYQSGDEKMALIRVDNNTNQATLIDTAIEVEYQDYRIRLKKYKTLLIFFDSWKYCYYDYSGKPLN